MTTVHESGADGSTHGRERRSLLGSAVPPPPGGAMAIGGMTALMHSVHLMSQATDGLRQKLSQQLRINTIDVTALITIYNQPDIRPTDLGRSLHMGSAGLTALANRLVRAGFVDRRPDPADRRSYRLRLTPAGVRATSWIFDSVAAALTTHLDAEGDHEAMTAVLVELSGAIERIELTDPGLRDGA